MKHPLQPLYNDEHGVVRFAPNPIVRFLLDNGGIGLNDLAIEDFDDGDRAHFAQLIGYSLRGFAELNYVSDEIYEAAECAAERAGLL